MDSWVHFEELPSEQKITDTDLEHLWSICPTEYNKIKIFGKEYNCPRYQKVFGREYTYSGTKFPANPYPKYIKNYMDYFSNKYNIEFNMALVNWYVNGEHNIGMHQDNEKTIRDNSPVITLSFGDTRTFKTQEIATKEITKYNLSHNMYLVMGGTFQKTHKHGIPKEKNKERRVSITLRALS